MAKYKKYSFITKDGVTVKAELHIQTTFICDDNAKYNFVAHGFVDDNHVMKDLFTFYRKSKGDYRDDLYEFIKRAQSTLIQAMMLEINNIKAGKKTIKQIMREFNMELPYEFETDMEDWSDVEMTPLGIYDFPKPSPKDSILKSFQDNPIHKQLKEIESLGYEVKPGKTSLGGDALQIVKKPVFKSTETISVGGFILPIYEPTTGSTKKLDTNFWCYLIGRGETRGYEELNELLSSIKMEDFDKHFPLAKQ